MQYGFKFNKLKKDITHNQRPSYYKLCISMNGV